MQTLSGALAGFCVGAFYNHSPSSLAATVAAAGLLTFFVSDRAGVGEIVAKETAEEAESLLHQTGGG